jgi:hypothetical protein
MTTSTDTPNYLNTPKMERVHTLEVPPAFWSDHDDRCTSLDDPIVGAGKNGTVKLTISDRDLDELHSSADHFSTTEFMEDEQFYFGLKASARATMRRIEAYWSSEAYAATQTNQPTQEEATMTTNTFNAAAIGDAEIALAANLDEAFVGVPWSIIGVHGASVDVVRNDDHDHGYAYTITATATGYEGGCEVEVFVPFTLTRMREDEFTWIAQTGFDRLPLAWSTVTISNPQVMDATMLELLRSAVNRAQSIVERADKALDRTRDAHGIKD